MRANWRTFTLKRPQSTINLKAQCYFLHAAQMDSTMYDKLSGLLEPKLGTSTNLIRRNLNDMDSSLKVALSLTFGIRTKDIFHLWCLALEMTPALVQFDPVLESPKHSTRDYY